ncbi:hypothetical protein [Rhizosphaericola mali]|uniref:Uncharacterized protein n=1 Tax=Rhizosphaericola mali TaxID=2545455 RepID=A0A5P2GBD5_9BACT|nr:hypothetical protein [Rhizosphaericola mali]QES88871.1 hypothetical protein E0W69_009455 [Rhizosphaericola mali]
MQENDSIQKQNIAALRASVKNVEEHLNNRQKNPKIVTKSLGEWIESIEGKTTLEIAESFKKIHDYLCTLDEYNRSLENMIIKFAKLIEPANEVVEKYDNLKIVAESLFPKN